MTTIKKRINMIFLLMLFLFSILIFLIARQSSSIFNLKQPESELMAAIEEVQAIQVSLRSEMQESPDNSQLHQQIIAFPKKMLNLSTADDKLNDLSLAVSILIDKHISFIAKGDLTNPGFRSNYQDLISAMESIEDYLHFKLSQLTEKARQDTISFYQLLTILFISILVVSVIAFIVLRKNMHVWVHARDQIRESERKFRVLAETAYDAIIMSDEDHNILFFNKAAERIFGYSFMEVNGLQLGVLFPAEENGDDSAIKQYLRNTNRQLIGHTAEITAKRKNGQDFPAEVSMGTWQSGGQTFVVSVIRDITQRRKLQELIYSYANEVFDLYNGAPCGYHSLNRKGYYMEVNQTELDWLGYEKNEVIRQKKITDIMTQWAAEKFELKFAELLQGRQMKNEEFEFVRKDGTVFPVLISATAIMDAEGNFLRTRSTVLDITQRKQQEEAEILHKASERNLQQLENAYSQLESFSYMASHDLKSPLSSLIGLIEVYSKSAHISRDDSMILDKMKALVSSMRQLIDDLLAFSRIDKAVISKTDINMDTVVNEVISEITTQPEFKNAAIVTDTIVPARGDASLLKVVWTNLLSNAVKYSSGNPDSLVEVNSFIQDGEHVYSVRDNGIGFDMKDYHKLFSVFKRLNGAHDYPGTGIGLASVKRVIEKHKGRVWAESAPGKGSTFYFTLPD